jgi:hypothetical protein
MLTAIGPKKYAYRLIFVSKTIDFPLISAKDKLISTAEDSK